MAITTRRALDGHRPTFTELFTPKLVTVLREGYGFAGFRAGVIAGLTVAIVALPLSTAIAIASGVTPDRGLTTAVIGGFIAAGRQPVSDRRTRRGVHRAGGANRRAPRRR